MVFNLFFSQLMADEKAFVADKRPQVSAERKEIEQSKGVIKNIKSTLPFVNVEEEKEWFFKYASDENPEDEDTADLEPDISWLNAFVEFISMLIEAALWIVPVVIVFYLYRYREYWMNLIQRKELKPAESELPETLFGLDMRQESLPENIEAEASVLWQQKHYRQAISLLYRGALASLFKVYRFELPEGATEQDCIKLIGECMHGDMQKIMAQADYSENIEQRFVRFKQLTGVWVATAYAHSLPDEQNFQKICHDWNRYFAVHKAAV